mgnify:CR=1 FL=1
MGRKESIVLHSKQTYIDDFYFGEITVVGGGNSTDIAAGAILLFSV